MGYRRIYNEMKEFYESDFTMDSFITLKDLAVEKEELYYRALKRRRKDSLIRFFFLKADLNDVVFRKLKEALHFEDETINKIMSFINMTNDIDDIYVLDGNVIAKLNNNEDSMCFVPTNDFVEINTKSFNNNDDINLKKYLVDSINNIVNNNILMINNDGEFVYNTPDISIYLNNSAQDIININENSTGEVTKLIIRNHDDFLYYDMKLCSNHLTFAQNEFKIHVVSEMLKKNNKVKTKK